ncbi:pilus assembly protein [Pseudomonas sp. S04]|uniref:fimbrial biogenesis chaperone n=1 Tax=unclassified Pseudomonas TaxID=196821 RepID=UPI00131FE419|nr:MULTISPECIES: molecular chaperone [unclassified Pseudomonas]QHD01158.1 pilus assembly protein [Pseudomonas sp. S04]QHF33642.1 pilus assembly protein [Pseudomonas sp. S19]
MFGLIKQAATSRPTLAACMTALMLTSYLPASQAALTLNGTRVVFDSDKRSVSLIVANPSDRTFAVQTWVNTAADDTTTAVPFIPSPPLFRLNPGKEQHIQINGLPNTLPTDRESLFYFNVQEIPQANANEGNVLNIALRTRIKLFYRPAQLKDNPVTSLKELQWSIELANGKPQLRVNNPTPFHVSFARIEVKGNGQQLALHNAEMLAPLSSQTYALDGIKPQAGLQVEFSAINDYGGYTLALTLPIQTAP